MEAPTGAYFFLTHDTKIPLVRERIVVDVEASVASVDDEGVHLRHDREELLARQLRPRDAKSSRQVAHGEDVSSVHRGDEDGEGRSTRTTSGSTDRSTEARGSPDNGRLPPGRAGPERATL